MKLLFDASALLNIIRLHEHDAYEILQGNLTLSLTKYEVGNALWKETMLLKRISIEEALEAISLLDKILKIMSVADPLSGDTAFKLAYNLQITYYDASYILAAAEKNAKLVTDDAKLTRKIQENTSIITEILGKKLEISSSNKLC
ncbi:MAG: type II toxin-antitoxin system VapC family toxin [Candidatus Bathyarchaeia archaeon]|nr:type II toxin-antitoxin system VapC family toxin [Candidatus Bathyarchaeota archaeon]